MIPNFVALVLDRLYEINQYLNTLHSWNAEIYRITPVHPLVSNPVIVVLPGRLINPISTPVERTLYVSRQYTLSVLLVPMSNIEPEITPDLDTVQSFIHVYTDYIVNHPFLEVDKGEKLQYLDSTNPVTLSDTGLISKKAPGNSDYLGVDFFLNVTCTVQLSNRRF